LLQISDLRLYSVAAVKFYTVQGGLIEDVEDHLLESAEGTIPPTPIAISLVQVSV
jgi:hypothetical protein